LIAVNAIIGSRQGLYFLRILTSFVGAQSNQLDDLLGGPNWTWSFILQITQPIFMAGRIKSNVNLGNRRKRLR
jgi:multidrug efflux system outer membrane protein